MSAKKKAPEPVTYVINFTKDRETKGTVRYAEDSPENQPDDYPGDAVVGTLYVRKFAAAAMGNPERVSLTLEVGL